MAIQRFTDHPNNKKPYAELSTEEKGIANLLATIAGYESDIAKIENEFVNPIQKRLSSGTFRWMEGLAIGPENIKDANDQKALDKINNVDIKLLSSHDLNLKLKYHQNEIKHLQNEIHGLRMMILELEHAAQRKHDSTKNSQSSKRNALYIAAFKEDPTQFFASIASGDEQVSSQEARDALFINAEKIIATCDLYDDKVQTFNLWLAWEVVDTARRIAEQQDATGSQDRNDKRTELIKGQEQLLNVLCKLLPPGMQGLKFLFNAKQYDKLKEYLEAVYIDHIDADQNKYEQLLNQLADQVILVSVDDAAILLSKGDEFNKLPEDMKKILIDQQAYIIRARFDLHYLTDVDPVTIDAIQTLLTALRNNIHSFLDPKAGLYLKLANAQKNFESGVAQINSHAQHFTTGTDVESDKIKLGSGLGLSWKQPSPRPRL